MLDVDMRYCQQTAQRTCMPGEEERGDEVQVGLRCDGNDIFDALVELYNYHRRKMG